MIYFTGDIHGAVDGIADFVNKIHPTMEDVIVLLGDVGANYYTGRRDNLLKAFLNDAGTVFLCIHGNHERRPNTIPGYVETEWNGGKAWVQPEYPKENLPPEHRTGKILRKDYWDVWPEARKEFFEDISAEDVDEFIRKASAQGEGSETVKERLPSMTANDFFRFCAMGYAENKYNGCDKTPKEQYYLHADGRDDGLKDLNPDDPEAFHAWLHDYSRGGGHPWEVCRGGNSTHVSLRPMDDKDGYFLYLDGDAWNRTIETVKFYLALTRAGIPVYLIEAHTLADRLAEQEWIGIVPHGVMPAYCESWFPNEHIIDYMNLPYDDREKFLPFCVWYDEEPIMLVTEKEVEPK